MRNELVKIELIENYLMGNLNSEEKAAFENKLKSDKTLEQEVMLQASIVEGLERIGLKQDILKAKKTLYFNKWIKITGTILLLGLGLWFGINHFFLNDTKKISEVKRETPVRLVDNDKNDTSSEKKDTADFIQEEVKKNYAKVAPNHTKQVVTKTEPTENIASIPEKKTQYFIINSKRDTVLEGEEGTIIKIPDNAFTTDFDEPLTLKLKEYYKMSDLIFSDLTTETTDGKILETGGMIHLEVKRKTGEKLKLKKDKSLELKFPFEERKEGMKLFKGEQRENNNIVWEESKEAFSMTDEPIQNVTKKTTSAIYTTGDREIFTMVEDMPYFIGCGDLKRKKRETCTQQKVLEYIKASIRIPEEVRSFNQDQTVYINYVVSASGYVKSVRVIRGTDKFLNKEVVRVIKSLPRFTPGKQRGRPVEVQFSIPVRVKFYGEKPRTYSKKEIEKFNESIMAVRRKEQEQTMGFLTDDTVSGEKIIPKVLEERTIADLEYYTLNSANLGWINCDRFNNYRKEKINFAVNESSEKAAVRLIFHDYKSLMGGFLQRGKIVFPKVPKGATVTVFALKVEKGIPYVAFQKTKVTKLQENLIYKRLTKDLLNQYTKQVNELAN